MDLAQAGSTFSDMVYYLVLGVPSYDLDTLAGRLHDATNVIPQTVMCHPWN